MSHNILKSYGPYRNYELVLEEVRLDDLPCFINLAALDQRGIPEILIELSTGCHHYNTMIRVTRKFMELFGVDMARVTAVRLARALGIENYEAVERGDVELRIKGVKHYPEWVSQNMDAIINAFNEVLASLGIMTQSVETRQQEVTQTTETVQPTVSAPTGISTTGIIKTYGSIDEQNLILRALSGGTHVELCLEKMGACKPLVTVRMNPLEVVIHEDAVKAFGENRAIEYATWVANALYVSNYEISESNNEVVLRSRENATVSNELIKVMDIIANKYMNKE